jgi:pilus assembly protein CpaB
MKTIRIIVAGENIKDGEILEGKNLRAKEIPRNAYFSRMIKEKDFMLINGASSRNFIEKGEPLLWDDIEDPVDSKRFSKTIIMGKRAVSIPANENITFSGLLKPGDHVDVYLTKGQTEGNVKTILLLENIKIAATDSNYDNVPVVEDSTSPSSVTLLLSKIQAASIFSALSTPDSKLNFVLRNPREKVLKKYYRKASMTQRIEIYIAGQLEKTMNIRTMKPVRGKK